MAKAKADVEPSPGTKSGPKPVYALVGSDGFLQLQKLSAIARLLPRDAQRFDLDGDRATLAEVLDEVRSFAMFGSGKLVVIRNAEAFITRFREHLEDYLAAPCDSATLVLRVEKLPATQRVYKLISKMGRIEDCNAPADPRSLAKWAIEQAKSAHRVTIAPDAAALLVELVGNDLGRLDSELEKLAIGSDGRPIDAKSVSGGVTFQREQEMWAMTNELAAGRPADALRRWRQLVQSDTSAEFRAVTWLTMWLEDVGVVIASKRGAGPGVGKLAWKYKDRLNSFIHTAEALGPAGHSRALSLLAEIDHQSKSGIGDAATNVERFILAMGAVS
jgi:DNA polymerase-3 subunit delta